MTDGKTIDELLDDWDGIWLESLKSQIDDIQHHRRLHDEFMVMLDGQHHPDTHVFREVFHRMYVDSQVMAIRRQVRSTSSPTCSSKPAGPVRHPQPCSTPHAIRKGSPKGHPQAPLQPTPVWINPPALQVK